MTEFTNVTVVKKANIYFDGRVTSRTVLFPDGERKTLGIMLPGEYEFSTAEAEIMEVLGGSMEVLLPGADHFRLFSEGEQYTVPADSAFKLKIAEPADYCCSYCKN